MASPTKSYSDKRSHSLSYVLLAAAVFACLLPFSGKAFHVDDTLFIYVARQITKHPLDPFGFKVNWFLDAVPMAYETKNPPLASYYIAAAASVVGWSERALHLVFLLPALAAVLGTHRLAQRFTRSPLVAAAATLLAPAFLVSASSVMCDTMMLALWLWAIIFWIEGLGSEALEPQKPRYLAISALLIVRFDEVLWHGFDSAAPGVFVGSAAPPRKLGLVPVAANSGTNRIPALDEGSIRTAHDHQRGSHVGGHGAGETSFRPGQGFGRSQLCWRLHAPGTDVCPRPVAAAENSCRLPSEWSSGVSH